MSANTPLNNIYADPNVAAINIKTYGSIALQNATDAIDHAVAQITNANKNATQQGAIYFPPHTYTIKTNCTIPAGVRVVMEKGAKFSVDSGKTLTIAGILDAPFAQIFSGSGTVTLTDAEIEAAYAEWWGATGDGTTDDNAALALAVASGAPLRLLEKTYVGYANVPTGCVIEGMGWQSYLKLPASANRAVIQNSDLVNGNTNISLRNFRVDGNKANNATNDETTCALRFRNLSNSIIHGIYIGNSPAHAMIFSGSSDVHVSNCFATGATSSGFVIGARATATASESIVFDGCIALSNSGDGFVIDAADGSINGITLNGCIGENNTDGITIQEGAAGVALNGCAFRDNTSDGIEITGGQTHVTVAGIAVNGCISESNSGTGLKVTMGKDISIIGGSYRLNPNGIRFEKESGGTSPTGIAISGAVVANNTSHGILLQDVLRATVTGCVVKNNDTSEAGGDGIRVGNASSDIEITGNQIYDDQGSPTQTYGVRLENTSDYIRTHGNNLRGNVTAGYVDNGSGTNNKVYRNVGYVTENSGTGSIASGATTAVVTHGLSITPTLDDIIITFGEQGSNDYGRWSVGTLTSTQFTLTVAADPGASNLDFGWRVVT